jgi:hypothetical protein
MDDNLSQMPDCSDTMSIRRLVDLVAYLESLTGPGDHDGRAGMGNKKMYGHAAPALMGPEEQNV